MFASDVFRFFSDNLKNTDCNYFEIGVYNGDGCYELSKQYPNKTIFCVDPFIEDGWTNWQTRLEKGKPLLSQRDRALTYFKERSNIKFFEMTSEEFFKNLTDQDTIDYNISYVFIDGDHSYEGASNDYKLAMKLIGNKEGIVVMDDTVIPGVAQAINEFKEMYKDRILEETSNLGHNVIHPTVTVFKIGAI
jgi:hypothetical protein